MSKCQNCGATMSCGCQRRTLPDGKAGCTKCVTDPSPAVKQEPNKTRYTNLKDSKTVTAPIVNNANIKIS
jgi:hypothetical protein